MSDARAPHEVHYATYLRLDELLATQHPISDHDDELHFIIVHQVHELWFKLALQHLERATLALAADVLPEAVRLVQQVTAIFDNLRSAVEHLQTLPPVAFHAFRRFLAPGSGLQSYQFREIEFLCGLREERHVKWVQRVMERDEHWAAVQARLDHPPLAQVLDEALERRGVGELAALYALPAAHPDLYALCEALAELDHRVTRWRFSHIQLVERTIGGATVGTGGTTADYLTATLQARLFPRLWQARNQLSAQVDAQIKDEMTAGEKGASA